MTPLFSLMTKNPRSRSKRSPQRTCLSCLNVKDKGDCLRFVLRATVLTVDHLSVMDGRGIYCCKTDACLRRLVRKKKKMLHAFRSIVPDTAFEMDCIEDVTKLLI